MFECRIENGKGNIVTLTQNESNYQVIQIDGLNPPNANINLTNIAGMDGARFNSSKLETRELVLYVKLRGNVESNRIMLYRYFSTKELCKFYYKNGLRDVFIEGYVQTVEVTPFTNNEIMQVSIICPQPYFKAMDEIIDDISKCMAAFKFPFSINVNEPVPISNYDANRIASIWNDSESETGILIEVFVLGAFNKITLLNVDTLERMTINNSDGFVYGDMIQINTYRGEKSVSQIRNGTTINLFSKLQSGFKFFQLSAGENKFSYTIESGGDDDTKARVEFKHRTMYRGV